MLRCDRGTEGSPGSTHWVEQASRTPTYKVWQGGPRQEVGRSLGTGSQEADGAAEKQGTGQGHLLALHQQQKGCWPEQGLGEGWEEALMLWEYTARAGGEQ